MAITISPEVEAKLRAKAEAAGITMEMLIEEVASDDIDERQAIAGINRGLADVEAGRVTPLRKFEDEFREQRGL